jgi:DNA-binding NarL/FixJ family response regulator
MDEVKIILVDDHNLFRNGLKLLLSGHPNMKVVAEASNGAEFLLLLNTTKVDVVLIDIEMPVMNGIEATRLAIEKQPSLKVISLSMYGEEEYYYRMIDAGVKGFILKNSEINEVIKAIQIVINGGTYFSSDVLYNVVKNIKTVTKTSNHVATLSAREKEVMEQICKGLSNQEIAEILFISRRTVEKHRSSLLAKTNTKNTAQLVMHAIENKLVDL